MPKIKITYKMAIILAAMSFGPMMAGHLVNLLTPDLQRIQVERSEAGQKIAMSCSKHLAGSDQIRLQRACRESLLTIDQLQSLRILRYDGLVLYSSPDHLRFWTLTPEAPSDLNQIRIPLIKGESVYAEIELAFEPVSYFWSSNYIRWATILGFGFSLSVGSFAFFLSRALGVLDPKNAVPKRVRNTLDTIVGGVVILDEQGKILLANDSFARWLNLSVDEVAEKELSSLSWTREEEGVWPWELAILHKAPKTGIKLHLSACDKEYTFMVNATPVFDGNEILTGALVSFEDISLMEEQRQHLLDVLRDLEVSREQIRRQNEVLHELATRDGLTGALNRRALFEKVEAIWEKRNEGNRGLITIMMDVDHFKKLNDQHGHTAGDAVLKDVVKVVSKIVDGRAVLSRYGGEEFCVIMQKATISEGEAMAEEIRAGIQTCLAEPYKVTASLGVSSSIFNAPNIGAQIEQADQGLYAAKRGGRNAFRTWSPQLVSDALEDEKNKAAKLAATDIEDHPISYHAVVSLNAALSKRFPKIAAHSNRVAEIAVELAKGQLKVDQLYTLEIAATLHDVGCLGMTQSECDLLKDHALIDDDRNLDRNLVTQELLDSSFNSNELRDIIKFQTIPYSQQHQYPGGIPLGARVIAIANSYDALTSALSDQSFSHEQAIMYMRSRAGDLFDPELVEKLATNPTGWRPENTLTDFEMCTRDVLMVGYQIERVIHSYESGNSIVLKAKLDSLESLAHKIDMPTIGKIIKELKSEVERKAIADWGSLMPIMYDLVELCLTVHRSHLRSSRSASQANDLPAAKRNASIRPARS
ncbi:MAG: diguanylate cyclase [Pirellula sp.]|jgi:diguanylate cyclase (GGDEF)-like protein